MKATTISVKLVDKSVICIPCSRTNAKTFVPKRR